MRLEIARQNDNGKIWYLPIMLKVSGISKYRDDQLGFEGIDNFWQMSDKAKEKTNGKIPPVGAMGWFKLSANPKRGPNARPGSMYYDIDDFDFASDEDKASYQAPSMQQPSAYAPKDDWMEKQPATQPVNPIALGMAFNNLTIMLAGQGFTDEQENESRSQQWRHWMAEAEMGKSLSPYGSPFSTGFLPVPDNGEDWQALDQADDVPQQVEEMPW